MTDHSRLPPVVDESARTPTRNLYGALALLSLLALL